MPPPQIGPYRIVRPLSEGGMGVVYEAIQAHIERRVALKILLPHHATNHETLERFFNEARAVNRIEHPSIVQISDYGQEPDGTAYLVMEYLRGEVLSERLDRTHRTGERLPLEDILQVAVQIAGALAEAHTKSVIHRDLKPSNVMLVKDPAVPRGERVKILDFGIAKLVHSQARGTAPNAVVGTPQYMSPEQCRGAGSVDDKTDVYALGLLLYEMVAGRPPFIAERPIEYIGQHAFREPPSLRSFAPTISDALAAFVHSLLIKDKEQRPPMRKAEAELSRLLAALSNPALPAPKPAADDGDETRPYLPSPSSPAPAAAPAPAATTKADPPGKAPRFVADRKMLLPMALAATGLLSLIAIVWGGYEYWARRPAARPATYPPPRQALIVQEKKEPGPQALPAEPLGSAPPAMERRAAPAVAIAATATAHPPVDVAETLRQMQIEHDKWRYPKVISLGLPIAKRSPSRAWRLIGSAACNLKDLKLVNRAFQYLDAPGMSYVAIVCAINGIQQVDGRFKLVPVKKTDNRR